MPNYGLYRITYFPFNDGIVYPQVRHGVVYVKCMFDTSGLSVDNMIPSGQEADSCIAAILANETGAARRQSRVSPRRISSYHHDYFNVKVQATFTAPGQLQLNSSSSSCWSRSDDVFSQIPASFASGSRGVQLSAPSWVVCCSASTVCARGRAGGTSPLSSPRTCRDAPAPQVSPTTRKLRTRKGSASSVTSR